MTSEVVTIVMSGGTSGSGSGTINRQQVPASLQFRVDSTLFRREK